MSDKPMYISSPSNNVGLNLNLINLQCYNMAKKKNEKKSDNKNNENMSSLHKIK